LLDREENSSLEKSSNATSPKESILNSYKFSRPRVYVKNCYESEDTSVLGHLKYISENIGPKSRTPAYNQFIDYQLRAPKPKKGKKGKPKGVSTNNIDFSSPTLKLAEFSIGKLPIKALVDTGSTHCLIAVSAFRKLNLSFQPLKIAMKVAGSILHDNIVGTTSAVIKFSTENCEVQVPTDFLIAHTINGYDAILGATILMDPEMVVAITPTHLCFTEEYSNISVPLINAGKDLQANHSLCDASNLPVQSTDREDTLHSLMSEEVPTSEFMNSEDGESIDEQIIAEHQLLDPSDLNKTFKYTDCEINPNLNPKIREKLDQILSENQTVFAKSKLDVGKFTGFQVSLLIDAEIPVEKQRFMSEEKLSYCKTTFKEFEKMGLVEECHSPKTISNLLLVPKYEGLRDLTKASVYLAQVKGEKNSSFRIVQDLRRINSKTQNIKKALPKLPEFIFQKLKNKVVSSIDANQAYWHLMLDHESRSYTAFYLQNRTLQFCRMPQGLASAPACWDEAMSRIFSSKTLSRVKSLLTQREADQLPDSFQSFFDFYQDDSWIFSDNDDIHLIHLKAVLMAYKMHDIKLSPNKCTFYPESFKILGVTLSPKSCELALSRVKAQSILDWEKPDSLYTLQSRLYALNYWMKFIPALAELKFPLQQIVRSQVFTWNEEADLAWLRLKALIAMDIRLTIPEQDEQLVITTDASKIACSCILWVCRKDSLRVVGCYSKLFSHTDSLKSIHFKETYALVLAFDHFKAYLLNTQKSVIVFTDARALMWVGRNREYSIACNGLVNKLAKIQLEIPHVVYSVPSEVNYLADIFSRAFTTSRFLEKAQFALSKSQANSLPPLTEPFVASESALYQYFALPLIPEESDKYPRKKPKVSTPKPISNLYKLFKDCTPEEKYLSALRLLQGWNDSSLRDENSTELNSCIEENSPESLRENSQPLEITDLLREKRADLYKLYSDKVLKKTINDLYGDLDTTQQKRVEATLRENQKSLYKENLKKFIKDDFMKFEREKEKVQKSLPSFSPDDKPIPIRYSVIRASCFHPVKRDDSEGIDIPLQDDITMTPRSHVIVDTGIQLVIPPTLCVRFIPNKDESRVNVSIHPGGMKQKVSSTVKLMLTNDEDHEIEIKAGTALVQALILHAIHPTLIHKSGPSCHPSGMTKKVVKTTVQSSSKEERETPGAEDESDSSLFTSSSGVLGSSKPITEIELRCLPTSYLHMMMEDLTPSCLHVAEINMTINLPQEIESKRSSLEELAHDSQSEEYFIPLPHPNPDIESLIQIYPKEMMREAVQLNSSEPTQTGEFSTENLPMSMAEKSAYNSICEKLAVVSVDLIKNGSMSRCMMAQLQQGDDYLGP
jgi:dUTPase